ncbi:MAG: dihydroorotase [Selenomonadaceae bacterium]|nr:dihydroorotase [Selenomonadaceae bacterium]
MTHSLLLRNGQVIDPANGLNETADVLIVDGHIAAVQPSIEVQAHETIDVSGKIVVPGLIDMHVHFREPGQEYKEDFESGSRAAAAGGFTTVATMPNTKPVVDNAYLVEAMVDRAAEIGLINIKIIGALTKGQKGEQLAEMAEMNAAGAVAFSDDGHFVDSAKIFLNALDYLKPLNKLVICHEEETTLVKGGSMNESLNSTRLGLKGRPSIAEDIAIARDCLLADYAETRVHFAHVSSARAVDIIRETKSRGVKVSAECTPQHLTLTDDLVNPSDATTKINPPLRTQADCDALLEGLLDGTIDCLVTDHSPHAIYEKEFPYDQAPSGFPGLETSLAVMLTELVSKGRMPLNKLIEKMTIAPAKVFGLDAGTLSVGAKADVTVFDPNLEWIVEPEKFMSKAKFSPFAGKKLKGKVTHTICGGKLIFKL